MAFACVFYEWGYTEMTLSVWLPEQLVIIVMASGVEAIYKYT